MARLAAMSLIVLMFLGGALPTHAEVRDGSFDLELYGGWYDPGPGALPGEPTAGARFGYDVTPRFFVQGTLGFTNFETAVESGGNAGTIDLDLWTMDFGFGYHLTEGTSVTPEVHAGFGGGFGSIGGDLQIDDTDLCGVAGCRVQFENLSENSFTLHGGVGVRIDLGDLLYLRPVVQTRWFSARDRNKWDMEYSVSLGFKFGGV
jgi:hypothetical protein